MLQSLVESRPRQRSVQRTLPALCFSVVCHGVLFAAVAASVGAPRESELARDQDTTIFWMPPQVPRPIATLERFSVVTPDVPTTSLPFHLVAPRFDVRGTSMTTYAVGFATSGIADVFDKLGAMETGRIVTMERTDEVPECIAGAHVEYPVTMRRAGIEGLVVLQAVVDTAGSVRQETIRVIHATQNGFIPAARKALARCAFRPGRTDGRLVPVLVQFPVKFELRGR